MTSELGPALPANRRTPWVVTLLCLVGLAPLYLGVRSALTADSFNRAFLAVLVTALLVILFVLLPLVFVWYSGTFSVHVRGTGPDTTITWAKGRAADRQLRLRDLTEVWANAGSRGPMGTSARSVTLNGTDESGEPVQIHVGRNLVSSLTPLLEPVAGEVARRPKLVKADPEGFDALLAAEGVRARN